MGAAPTDMRRLAAVAFAVVVALLGVVVARGVVESRREFRAGQAAEAGEDIPSAILHYRRAANWYVPLVATSGRAVDALIVVGDASAESGDLETALLAWRGARSAIMATRHFVTPHSDALPDLHARIADAMAEQRTRDGETREEAASRYRAQLDGYRERAPSLPLSGLASLFFVGWLGCWAVALGASNRTSRWRVAWIGAGVLSWAAWLLLVRLA